MAQTQVQHQATAATVGAPGGSTYGQLLPTPLYVGDLDFNVTDSQLYDLFSQVGQVASVKVCRDICTCRSLGYGYVNYRNPQDAAKAIQMLNFTRLNNKSIRIMYSLRDPSIRKSGIANIFIKNLDKTVDNKALHDTFSSFGNILSCKVATDQIGESKGYGFVQFDNEESSQSAIDKLNGMVLNDKQLYVAPFLRKQERETVSDKTKFNNVYVKNLAKPTTEDDLENIFGEYGIITSCKVMRDADGKSKCFGFVNFANVDDAAKAVEALNGQKFDEKEWYVGRAQTKSEREAVNLYVRNLDDSIDNEKLKQVFSEFGTITSCKVMRHHSGRSKKYGFVAFSTAEEASRALSNMHGKTVIGKPLYVSLAQRKEDRRAHLQAQFQQIRPLGIPQSMAPRMPTFPHGVPRIGQQQLFYGQPPAIIPPQIRFGCQPQLGSGPMPNFSMPFFQQPQRPPARDGPDRMAGWMLPVPYDVDGMLPRDAAVQQPTPITGLDSTLANGSPEHERMMLGENLYGAVDEIEQEEGAKVAGMEQREVVPLVESQDGLKAAEIAEVEVENGDVDAEQLATLSLNDNLIS